MSDRPHPQKPKDSRQQMRPMLQAHIPVLRKQRDTHLLKSKARYKHDYDHIGLETPAFHTREYVHIKKPPLSSLSNTQAETLVPKHYSKLQNRTTGPFSNVSVQKHTVTIDEDSIPNTVSTENVTHTPSVIDRTQRETTTAQPKLDLVENSTHSNARDSHKDKDEYVVK